jgi:hypothetical protein
MGNDRGGEVIKGTLEMIVRILQHEPMHGWGITERICRSASLPSRPGDPINENRSGDRAASRLRASNSPVERDGTVECRPERRTARVAEWPARSLCWKRSPA